MNKAQKAAIEDIVKRLDSDFGVIQQEIRQNKWKFKTLAEEQARLKRERSILWTLMNNVKASMEARP